MRLRIAGAAAPCDLWRCAVTGLSTRSYEAPDSHPRHRSRASLHRLGPHRIRRQPADLRRLRRGRDQRTRGTLRAAGFHSCRIAKSDRGVCAATRPRSSTLSSTPMRARRSSSGRRAASPCWCRRRPGLSVAEYAPNLVKKSIVGAGHADKAQIRMMIGVLLPKASPQSEDAADALAIAVTHAHHRQSLVLKVAAR